MSGREGGWAAEAGGVLGFLAEFVRVSLSQIPTMVRSPCYHSMLYLFS